MSDNQSTFDLTPAQEMEAEERELVITDSVQELEEYAQKPLSDKEIEANRLHLEDIKPKPNDI